MNVPRRGIGETTENLIYDEARNSNKSVYDYLRDVTPGETEISKRCLDSLKAMIQRIEIARNDIDKSEEVFSKILEDMIYSIGYQDYLMKEDDGDERWENVKALFEDIRHYSKNNPESTFDDYLQNIALVSAQDEIEDGDYVTLMTVHTAKGLEFPVVFIVRLNQGIFPNQRALMESGFKGLEEERRLAYVAMTRAKERLYLTFSSDYSYVLGGSLTPSQFIVESGNNIIRESTYSLGGAPRVGQRITSRTTFNDGAHLSFEETPKDAPRRQNFEEKTNGMSESDWHVGDIVLHKTLGRGKVIELEGDGIIKVNFEQHGIKSIMGNHPFVSKGV
jgi:DNA helicase-2/ATP-dependent DNA helicase PcrA